MIAKIAQRTFPRLKILKNTSRFYFSDIQPESSISIETVEVPVSTETQETPNEFKTLEVPPLMEIQEDQAPVEEQEKACHDSQEEPEAPKRVTRFDKPQLIRILIRKNSGRIFIENERIQNSKRL